MAPSDESSTRLLIDEDDHPQPTDHPPPASNNRRRSSSASTANSDFVFIKIVARLFLQVIKRFWAFSSAALFAIILLYWLLGGFFAFALLVFAFTGLFYHASDRMLYHPDQPPNSRIFVPSPSMFGLKFENLYIRSKDSTRLHIFVVQPQDPEVAAKAPTVLYLHGNAGNIGHRLLNVKGLVQVLGCNVCMLEYRGYGHSDGTPSEEGLYLDAQAGLDYLCTRADIDTSKIVIFGRSLGGAVAIDLCSRAEYRDKVSCVLLENTFTSIPDIAKHLFNFRVIRCIPAWFYKNRYRSRWKVCKMSTPTLFLSGMADALIPPRMMAELFNLCGAPVKRLAKFPGGSHNETWQCPQYYQTISYFLEEVVQIGDKHGARNRVTSPPPLVGTSNVV